MTLALFLCSLLTKANTTDKADVKRADSVKALSGTTINPNGIFFNRFSGSFSGTEWFQTTPIPGTNRYQLVDIFGGGFDATITPDGQITLDGNTGMGSFSDENNYVIMPDLGTVFTFTCNRVPLTDATFPLNLENPRPANELFSGRFDNVIESFNPETGAINPPGNEELLLSTMGNTLRITDPGDLYFQGVFENGRQIVFRKIVPNPNDPSVASFPESDINFNQNLIASVYFHSINHFTGIFLLQSRDPLGSQQQLAFRFSSTRIDPFEAGDVNGDGAVNAVDRDLIVVQLGNDVESDNYNLAADLNLDNIINDLDLMIFDKGDFVFLNGFE